MLKVSIFLEAIMKSEISQFWFMVRWSGKMLVSVFRGENDM